MPTVEVLRVTVTSVEIDCELSLVIGASSHCMYVAQTGVMCLGTHNNPMAETCTWGKLIEVILLSHHFRTRCCCYCCCCAKKTLAVVAIFFAERATQVSHCQANPATPSRPSLDFRTLPR
mmetsp:Transcript_6313/g.13816  ORF Transcript_6313/g.13816 Transcript_6313/m.13816 type:complete len:120 (-) Transcript_6313:193-552(-)